MPPLPIIRYSQISKKEKALFWEAYYYSFISRLAVSFLPLKRYSIWLGQINKVSQEEEVSCISSKAYSIAHAVRRSSRFALWPTKCLVDAMTAKKMLDKRNIPSTIYLGVSKDAKKELIAHAWLRCGNAIILGRKGMSRFKVVACFS